MSATIATVNVMLSENLLSAAEHRGNEFIQGYKQLIAEFPDVLSEVRGRGLMLGLDFVDNESGVEWAKFMFSRGVLTSGTLSNAKVIRIEPPLTITPGDVQIVLAKSRESLQAVRSLHTSSKL